MSVDRRPEIISATLCVLLSVASFWAARSLALWLEPNVTIAMGCGIAATEYVLAFSHAAFSLESLPWLAGMLLIATGVLLRRRQRADTAALALLFVGPLAPVAMLVASVIALLLPFQSLVLT